MDFKINEEVDAISFGKALDTIVFVFPDTFVQITCDPSVQRAIRLARIYTAGCMVAEFTGFPPARE